MDSKAEEEAYTRKGKFHKHVDSSVNIELLICTCHLGVYGFNIFDISKSQQIFVF